MAGSGEIVDVSLSVLEKINLSPGKVLKKGPNFFFWKGHKPCPSQSQEQVSHK